MNVTFTRKGYIELWKGSTYISRHVSDWEAVERAMADAAQYNEETQVYRIKFPEQEIKVDKPVVPEDPPPPSQPTQWAVISGSPWISLN